MADDAEPDQGRSLRRSLVRLRPAVSVRDPQLGREARGEVGVLACLLAVVGLLCLVASAGPPLLDRLAGQGLVSRFDAAQDTRAVVRQSAVLHKPVDGVLDPSSSTLGGDLDAEGSQLLHTARKPLAGVLTHESTRVVVNAAGTTTAAGPVRLGLLYADDAPPRSAYTQGRPPGRPTLEGPIPIAVSQRTRDALHLRLGQVLHLSPRDDRYETDAVLVGVYTAPPDGKAPLWREQPLLERPLRGARDWQAQALIDPAALDALQGRGADDLTVSWQSAVRMSDATASPLATDAGLKALRTAANRYGTESADALCPQAEGFLAVGCAIGKHGTDRLATADDIPRITDAYGRARAQARTLESFALAGLVAIGLVTVVVTARLALQRRAAAQALQRARGASATDLAFVRLAQTAPAALIGLLIGRGAAWLIAPSGQPLGSPVPAVAVATVAWLTLPALTWAALRDRGRSRDAAPTPARRLTVEAGVLALAVAGVLALRARGAGGGGIDPQLAAVPALLGIATVVLLIRVYPLPLRLLARAARRRSGAVGLISLSRAARAAPGQALALLVLVTTLSTAVFGGLVSQTVTDGRRAAAVWTAGADATVIGAGKDGTPDAALTGLPGVRRAVEMRGATSQVTSGRDGYRIDNARIVGVDATALHAAAPGSGTAHALLAAGLAGRPRPTPAADGTVVLPALASPEFGTAAVGDIYTSSLRTGRVSFRVVGLLPPGTRQDPALGPLLDSDAARAVGGAAGGTDTDALATAPRRPLLVVDASAMGVLVGHDTDFSAVLLYGPHLDVAALHVTAARLVGPTGDVRVGSEELASARQDGLLRGVQRVYAVSTAFAVLFALLALVLELLLSARDRGRTASRLRTLGLPTRGIAALNILELLPMALAAAAGGIALGLALPGLLGPALSLRAFTGGQVAPALHTDYALTVALALGLAALVAAAVALETWLGRRRGLGAVLRLGDAA